MFRWIEDKIKLKRWSSIIKQLIKIILNFNVAILFSIYSLHTPPHISYKENKNEPHTHADELSLWYLIWTFTAQHNSLIKAYILELLD